MAWDAAAKNVAIRVIGTVESSMNYGTVYTADPITVGLAQWFGVRAASILTEIKAAVGESEWEKLPAGFRTTFSQHGASDRFWNTYYLPSDTVGPMKTLLRHPEAMKVQNTQIVEDLDHYVKAAKAAGLDADTNTKTFVYWCCIYHQYPKAARQFLATYGGGMTVDQLHRVTMAHSWLKKFPNRYNTTLRLINEWNTSPPIGGVDEHNPHPDGPSDSGGSTPAGSSVETTVKRIEYVDRIMWLLMRDGRRIRCEHHGGGVYYPWGSVSSQTNPLVNETVPPTDPVNPPPGPGGSDLRSRVVKWMTDRIRKFRYSQGPGRLNPDKTGYGDCSSTVYRAYLDVAGKNIGTWTMDQQKSWAPIIYEGPIANLPTSKLLPADLIFYWAPHQNGGQWGHVEMVVSQSQVIGHPSGQGPYLKPVTYLPYPRRSKLVRVRRYLS